MNLIAQNIRFGVQLMLIFCAVWVARAYAQGEDLSEFNACVLSKIKTSSAQTPIVEITRACENQAVNIADEKVTLGSLSQRILAERATEWNRSVLAAYGQNYILPYNYSNSPNTKAYEEVNDWGEYLRNGEAKFQVSLKIPLTHKKIFRKFDGFYFGFTVKSWWQIYANDISRPFRETNYQPELFYLAPLKWSVPGGNTGMQLGIAHESNGRSQLLSRSWNRVYAAIVYEGDTFAVALRPWYRIPETKKVSRTDSNGDDNPDIANYLGNFDIRGAKKLGNNELSFMLRNNLRQENRGAIELGYSFPLTGHLKGFVQYFNGYGDSLIDYDRRQSRLGLGILITDWL